MSLPTKYELIKRLSAANGDPISGQQLADDLNISRTAIWKHMKQLEEEGYKFESIRKKGYMMLSAPDTLDPAKITAALETEQFGKKIIYEKTLSSTQTTAHQQAQDGAPNGTVVICEEQTEGRGRLTRPWKSQSGKGIAMSIILRPNVPPYEAPQFTLVGAVAVTCAIRDVAGIRPDIKWPNDLLINGLKCTGILTEMQADPDRVNAIIMGIGINVNHDSQDFDVDIANIATSLKITIGKQIDRAELVAKILYYLEKFSNQYIAEGFTNIKALWEEYSCTIGSRIKATTLRDVFVGKAIGITNEGILKLQLDDGTIKEIYSADIELEK